MGSTVGLVLVIGFVVCLVVGIWAFESYPLIQIRAHHQFKNIFL